MGRDIDSREERTAPVMLETRTPEEPSRERRAIRGRGYAFQISDSELETLHDVGRFRTIAVEDLARERYHGNKNQFDEDLRSLQAQNLVQRRTLWTAGRAEQLTIVALSKSGKSLLENHGRVAPNQAVYCL